MSDIPEPARKMQRLMMVAIIIAGVAAIAYASANWLSPEGETACAPGEEIARNNPPGKSPRFVCKPTNEQTHAEN